MVFAAYLLKNAILVLSRVGHLHPIIKPHRGAFVAFPKQMTNARHVHAWNWLSHISVPCFCAVVASQTNWENTLNFKQSLVTDTQARRIITVSNIDQVIFFLIMLTHCFFPATIQLAKCNVLMTRDTIDLAKPLSNKMLCSTPGCDTKLVSSWVSFNPLDMKKKGIKAFVYHSHRLH